jgi:polygalacturonase
MAESATAKTPRSEKGNAFGFRLNSLATWRHGGSICTLFENRKSRSEAIMWRRLRWIVLFAVGLSGCAAIPGRTFNVLDYGAIGDGKSNSTIAIQKAIDACSAAGGGRVLVPRGTFLTGPITLASGMKFYLADGSELLFSRNFDDYPLVYANFLGKDTVQCTSPITGRNLHNISIAGSGVIDGQGDAWRPVKKSKVTQEFWNRLVSSGGVVDQNGDEWWPTRAGMENEKALDALRESNVPPKIEDYRKFRDLLRPDMVALIDCTNVAIDGPTFRNSPFWAVQILRCNQVYVRGSTIYNELWAQNGDGIGFDSSRNIMMENCTVYAGDDNIVLKSGKDEEGRKRHLPTENVMIRHCTSMWGHGGFVLGSETSGDIRNVQITDCVCDGTDVGLRFKSVRGRGGVVENIYVANVTMSHIAKQAVSFDMYYEEDNSKPEPLSERTPCFRNFDLRNICCQSAGQSLLIDGLPELPMSDLRFENMRLAADTGAKIAQAKDLTFKNVEIESKIAPAFSTENVRGLTMQGVEAVVRTNEK